MHLMLSCVWRDPAGLIEISSSCCVNISSLPHILQKLFSWALKRKLVSKQTSNAKYVVLGHISGHNNLQFWPTNVLASRTLMAAVCLLSVIQFVISLMKKSRPIFLLPFLGSSKTYEKSSAFSSAGHLSFAASISAACSVWPRYESNPITLYDSRAKVPNVHKRKPLKLNCSGRCWPISPQKLDLWIIGS